VDDLRPLARTAPIRTKRALNKHPFQQYPFESGAPRERKTIHVIGKLETFRVMEKPKSLFALRKREVFPDW
jgi:hypothetical protein